MVAASEERINDVRMTHSSKPDQASSNASAEADRPAVGLIGVGLLGSAIAQRLFTAGFPIFGFDQDDDRMADLQRLGGKAVESAAEVAANAHRIVLSLPTADVSRSVIDQLKPQLAAGSVIIDTTTSSPNEMSAIGGELNERGVKYLDATVGGSSEQARSGDVIVMAGGSVDAFNECRDIFDAFARQVFRVGECGAGAKMKLVTNLVLGLTRAALAEGLHLAKSFDLDLPSVLEVLQAGPAASRPMETKGQKMLTGDFSPQARLSQHLKDVRLMLDSAADFDTALPLSQLHEQLLSLAESQGDGALDNSAILRVFDCLPSQTRVELQTGKR